MTFKAMIFLVGLCTAFSTYPLAPYPRAPYLIRSLSFTSTLNYLFPLITDLRLSPIYFLPLFLLFIVATDHTEKHNERFKNLYYS